MKAALCLILSAALILSSGGTSLLAKPVTHWDPLYRRLRVSDDGASTPIARVARMIEHLPPKLRAAALQIGGDQRLSQAERERALAFLVRYRPALAGDQKAAKEIDATLHDLRDPEIDPGLTLARMFDHLSRTARMAERDRTDVQWEGDPSHEATAVVSNSLIGNTTFIQHTVRKDADNSIRTITRPADPDDPSSPQQLEAVVLEQRRGADTLQRVCYNRRIHVLLRNLRKLYYDQCSLVRRVNNGELLLQDTPCQDAKGWRDEKLTPEVRRKLQAFYDGNRRRFPPELLDYLDYLDRMEKQGRLGNLRDWRKLQSMQRLALAFYNDNQLQVYQRAVIMEITNYFSQLTGVQPKQKRGEEMLDIGARKLEDFQRLLDQFHKGRMEGYSSWLAELGFSKLDIKNRRDATSQAMDIVSEAFADVAYAYQAQQRLLDPDAELSGAERDAAIAETSQWLQLAQIQVTRFEMLTESTSLDHLAAGTLRGIGIQRYDEQMKGQARRLASAARRQYYPAIAQASRQAKRELLRQTVSELFTTFNAASTSWQFRRPLREKLRLLAAKADQLLQLYLSAQFEAARDNPSFQRDFTESQRVEGSEYAYFLSHLPANCRHVRELVSSLKEGLLALLKEREVGSVRQGLAPLRARFAAVARAIFGDGDIPTPLQIQRESQALSVRQGRLFAAAAQFANKMRLFDAINELDIYVDKYADNTKWLQTENDGFWTQLTSFQWLNYAFGKVPGREAAADAMLRNAHIDATLPLLGEVRVDYRRAFEELRGHPERRFKIDQALREGRFDDAYRLVAKIDPEGAQKAEKEARLDKLDEDPADLLDLDGLMSHQYQDTAQTRALGSIQGAFVQLPKLITGYALATAVTDTVISAVASAAIMPVAPVLLGGLGEATLGVGRFVELVPALDETASVGRMTRIIHGIASLFNAGSWAVEYPGKVMISTARTARKAIGMAAPLEERSAWVQAAAMYLPGSGLYANVACASIGSTAIMGLVSGGMSAFTYARDPETSRYENAGEAFMQGLALGASFGSKAGIITHINLVPVSAFRGWVGATMRTVAETPGPVSLGLQTLAKVVPGWSKSMLAEAGPLGALSNGALALNPVLYTLGKAAVWGGAMIDGTVKYIGIAWLPQQLAQVGIMLTGQFKDAHGHRDATLETEAGDTAFMERLSAAQQFSTSLAQLSWVLMPSNPAFSHKEISDQSRAAAAFNRIAQDPELLRVVESAPKDFAMPVELPFYYRSLGENARAVLGAVPLLGRVLEELGLRKPASTVEFQVTEQWRQLAARERMRRRFSTAEIMAMALMPSEAVGRLLERSRLGEVLRDRKAFIEESLADKGPRRAGEDGRPLILTPATRDPVDVRVFRYRDPATGRWRDAREGEVRLVCAAPVPLGQARGRDILEVVDPQTGHWVPAGTPGSPAAMVLPSARPDQVRVTNEAIMAARDELSARLRGRSWLKRAWDGLLGREVLDGAALRGEILLSEDALDLGNGWQLSGERLADLKKEAALVQLDAMPATRNPIAWARDMVQRGFDTVFRGRKLESQQQRWMRGLRPQVEADARRLAESEKGSLGAVREQILDLLGKNDDGGDILTDAGDRAVLQRALDVLGGRGRLSDRLESAAVLLDEAAARKGQEKAGLPPNAFASLSRSLRGEVTADLLMTAARRRLQRRIDAAGPLDRAALEALRQPLETDAARQVVIAEMLRTFGRDRLAARDGELDSASAREGGELDRALDLYMDVWERAVLGQMAGERVAAVKNGRDVLEWSIPARRQFKNRFGATIGEFRALQKRVIKETLGFFAGGSTLVFGAMPTGSGKTLTNCVLAEFLDTMARSRGRDGVIYLTTNPDLVAQAYEDYVGFFGKKPPFEIMTYSDLSARVAQAKEQGLPSPLERNYLIGDEGDAPAGQVPTSVGVFNGRMSKARIDPVQQAMQGVARRFADGDPAFWAEARAAHGLGGEGPVEGPRYEELMKDEAFRQRILEGEGGGFRRLQAHYGLTGVIDKDAFRRLKKNEAFMRDFEDYVQEAAEAIREAAVTLRSKSFRDGIDLTQYPDYYAMAGGDAQLARRRLQDRMIEEYDHMVASAKALHGSLEGRMRMFLEGGMEFASLPERSKKIVPDPDVERDVLNFNNGIAYDNLSTPVGPFGSAYFGRNISNEFESAGQLNFAQLIEEAVANKAVFFLTSGTCPLKVRELFQGRYRAKFTGEVSIPDPFEPRLATGELAQVLDIDAKIADARAGELQIQYVHTLPEQQEVLRLLEERGVDMSRVSVLVRPASALEKQERLDMGVRAEANAEGFKGHNVDFVLLVGAAGLRGLEMNLKDYAGRSARMDILDPQELDTGSLTQLIGRLSRGRAWMLNVRRFTSVTRLERLERSVILPQAAGDLAGLVAEAASDRSPTVQEAALRLSQSIRADSPVNPMSVTPQDIIEAVQRHDADTQRFLRAAEEGRGEGFVAQRNDLYDRILLPMLKNPNLPTRITRYLDLISEVGLLRRGLSSRQLESVLGASDPSAAAIRLFSDPAVLSQPGVLDVLIASLGRREQDLAIQSSGILDESRPSAQNGPTLGKLLRPGGLRAVTPRALPGLP
ncbi:MAG: DEAD/DEAH box helicase family protein [Elusimicrobia bacterium]|nr:DEAD/DEAH box helicase family protein [Elusimicrobiota bacterium]MDE2425799.1 DEAD/DEAH box helicase family protein [Elusimicrobiota bacterium]